MQTRIVFCIITVFRQNFCELLDRRETALQPNAHSITISNIQHICFSDAVLYSPLLEDAINHHPAVNQFALTFFDQFLMERVGAS